VGGQAWFCLILWCRRQQCAGQWSRWSCHRLADVLAIVHTIKVNAADCLEGASDCCRQVRPNCAYREYAPACCDHLFIPLCCAGVEYEDVFKISGLLQAMNRHTLGIGAWVPG